MGFDAGLKAFTAAVLGGNRQHLRRDARAGWSSASRRTLATAYIANVPGMHQFGGSSWANVWAFVLLILVLLFRPAGLLGERVADRA